MPMKGDEGPGLRIAIGERSTVDDRQGVEYERRVALRDTRQLRHLFPLDRNRVADRGSTVILPRRPALGGRREPIVVRGEANGARGCAGCVGEEGLRDRIRATKL